MIFCLIGLMLMGFGVAVYPKLQILEQRTVVNFIIMIGFLFMIFGIMFISPHDLGGISF